MTNKNDFNQKKSNAGVRGGHREGAGRKLGSVSVRSREIAHKAIEGGISPLEVMLAAMRYFWKRREFTKAVDIAKGAAPYVHPRLNAIDAPKEKNSEYINASMLPKIDYFDLMKRVALDKSLGSESIAKAMHTPSQQPINNYTNSSD
ncbi:MAG: hypothetical protein WC521_07155 [Bdellovibrionales bacterium]